MPGVPEAQSPHQLKPEPEPPPPAPPQPQMTLEDVVRAFGEPVQPYDDATYIGTDEDEPDTE